MRIPLELVAALQYELKAAQRQSALFKSGQEYTITKRERAQEHRRLEQQIKALREGLHRLHQEQLYARQQQFESTGDVQAKYKRQICTLQAENARLYKRSMKAETRQDAAYDKITEMRKEKYQLATELEEEKGKNQKLAIQSSKDSENSSLPSSARPIWKKKIPNSREAIGKKPGGQSEHPGHGRKKQIPSQTILLQSSPEILGDPDLKKIKKTAMEQLVNLQICLNVTEYKAEVYRSSKTGESCRAEFPAGETDGVNCGSSVKVFLLLLNHDCCVFIGECRDFLKDLTGGRLDVFKRMISRLSKEFAEKSKPKRKPAVSEIYLYPVMHADCTNTRVNGKSVYVFICMAPNGPALYYTREVKGHGGMTGTPVKDHRGVLIHDHEKAFYKYGCSHQKCLAYVLRYLKGSMEDESESERK